MKTITTHDIESDGKRYIMEWAHSEEGNDTVTLTEAVDDTPCEWFVNNGKPVQHWCCNTHMFDGTNQYPASGDYPAVCDFSPVDENGEVMVELETYDFTQDN